MWLNKPIDQQAMGQPSYGLAVFFISAEVQSDYGLDERKRASLTTDKFGRVSLSVKYFALVE